MVFSMVTKYAHSPEDIAHYDTEKLREEFLSEQIFSEGDIKLTYTYNDRMIFGGVVPAEETLEIKLDKELGVEYFLQRRELGFINLGAEGLVTIDGKEEKIAPHDGFYIGRGTREVKFSSVDSTAPAKFYIVSTPAHKTYPNKKLVFKNAIAMPMGDQEHMNKRTIYKYIDASQMDTCQLQMGYTVLDTGNSWNTMPSHTHARRMETYLYVEFAGEDTRVIHFMGKPDETKHVFMNPGDAIVSPSWSIHSGVGTGSYAFIWAMCGENQTYDDMDQVDMHNLK